MFAYTITPNRINLLLSGRARTIDKSHINYQKVRSALVSMNTVPDQREQIISEIKDMVDIPAFVARITCGRVQLSNDAVAFDGKQVKSVIADRLLELLHGGFEDRKSVV